MYDDDVYVGEPEWGVVSVDAATAEVVGDVVRMVVDSTVVLGFTIYAKADFAASLLLLYGRQQQFISSDRSWVTHHKCDKTG